MEHKVNAEQDGDVRRDMDYHISKIYDVRLPEVAPMKGIGDVPLGDPDWSLFVVSLSESLEKSRHTRSKLHGLR